MMQCLGICAKSDLFEGAHEELFKVLIRLTPCLCAASEVSGSCHMLKSLIKGGSRCHDAYSIACVGACHLAHN